MAVVQHKAASIGAVSAATITFSNPVSVNNRVIIAIHWFATTKSVSSVTDNGSTPNSYNDDLGSVTSTAVGGIDIRSANVGANPSSGNLAVTVHFNAKVGGGSLNVWEVVGLLTDLNAVDVTGTANVGTASTALTVSTGSPSSAVGGFVAGYFAEAVAPSSASGGTGTTLDDREPINGGISCHVTANSSAATETVNVTIGTAQAYLGGIVAYQLAVPPMQLQAQIQPPIQYGSQPPRKLRDLKRHWRFVPWRHALSSVPPSTNAWQNVAARFRLVAGAAKSVQGRYRLTVAAVTDIQARFQLLVRAVKDVQSRFRLAVQAWGDVQGRYRLTVRAVKDVQVRFRLIVQATKDVQSRFRLTGQSIKDVASRFKLLAGTLATRDVQSRFRLNAQSVRDVASRFRLNVRTWRDLQSRFRLVASALKDAQGRFKLAVGAAKDVQSRFRLRAAAWRDVQARLRLAVGAVRDLGGRFRLLGVSSKTVAVRFRLTPAVGPATDLRDYEIESEPGTAVSSRKPWAPA